MPNKDESKKGSWQGDKFIRGEEILAVVIEAEPGIYSFKLGNKISHRLFTSKEAAKAVADFELDWQDDVDEYGCFEDLEFERQNLS
jgi:hypothetical protein